MITLCIFARAPELGRVKTRLAQRIGDDAALAVYHALLAHTAHIAHTWTGPVHVFGAGDLTMLRSGPLGAFLISEQHGNNLGARLLHGMQTALNDTPAGALAIGTDCAALLDVHLQRVASLLSFNPVSIGPARDGGYWSIGLSDVDACEICFADDLPWSTQTLLSETRKRLSAAGLNCGQGDLLDDIDTPNDLAQAEAAGFRWDNQGQT